MRACFHQCGILTLFAASCLSWSAVRASIAQEPKKAELPPVDKKFEVPFWDSDRGANVRALVGLLAARDVVSALGTRVAINENVPALPEWQFVFDKAFPLDERYLGAIKDKRPLPNLINVGLDELKDSDLGIYGALCQALLYADRASPDMFERSAEENKHVVYADLKANSSRYRGKVISVKGTLLVIRKKEAPRYIKNHLKDIYYGYIVGPTKGVPPVAVVFTELPAGLDVSEKVDMPVTLNGYYLGLNRFQADKENRGWQKDVISPYVVGKTMIVHAKPPPPPAVEESYSYPLIVSSLGVIVAIGFFVIGLNLWFRRGDKKTQSQLADLRDRQQPFSLEPAEGSAKPSAETRLDLGFDSPPNNPGEDRQSRSP